MASDAARKRGGKGGQQAKSTARPEKSDVAEPESGSGAEGELSPKRQSRKGASRGSDDQRKTQSSTLVTVISIVIVVVLVAVTYTQLRKKQSSVREDDIPPLEDLQAHDRSEQDSASPRNPGGREDHERSADDRPEDGEDPEDDYDNPDGDEPDSEDDDVAGAKDGRAHERKRASSDVSDMKPSEPMEDDYGPMDEPEAAKNDADQNLQPQQNSLMRPHEPVKVNYWKHIVQRATEQNATELHSNIMRLDNVLSASECFKLIKYHEELVSDHVDPPPWCFESESWINRALSAAKIPNDVDTFAIDSPTQGRMFCAKSAAVHEKLSEVYPYSTSTLIPRGENELLDAIERKLDSELGLPKDNAYHSQLIKYKEGEKYYPHVDCDASGKRSKTGSNDRMATIIIYLSDVKAGGATTFPTLGVSMSPRRGAAIVFRNLDDDRVCDKSMLHKGDPPLEGVKYIYQHWYHEGIILPANMENIVLCDNSDSCREYIHSRGSREAHELVKQGDKARPNLKKSLDFYKQALKKQPNHAQALLYAADNLAQLKQNRESLGFFEKHLKLHPKSIDANFVAAGVWQEVGRRGKAIELLQRVIAVSPRDNDALYNIATLYADEGHTKKAVSALKAMLKVTPSDHGGHSLLADLLSELGDDKGAAEHRKEAARLKTRSRQ